MKFLALLGVLAIVVGLFWVGQGLGYINWPAESFMISQKQWVYYGGGLALAGLVVLLFARR